LEIIYLILVTNIYKTCDNCSCFLRCNILCFRFLCLVLVLYFAHSVSLNGASNFNNIHQRI
jgi:hypothetical protein